VRELLYLIERNGKNGEHPPRLFTPELIVRASTVGISKPDQGQY